MHVLLKKGLRKVNGKFEEGTVVHGEDLKGYMLYKILPENMSTYEHQYRMGMNVYTKHTMAGGRAGLRFCLAEDICRYLYDGDLLAIVSIPDCEDVYIGNGWLSAKRLDIKNVLRLDEVLGKVESWECLLLNGMDITGNSNYAVGWAARNGYLEVVQYLHRNGADITADGNYAVIWAAERGHLDVVRYLHENGADIMADDNYAIKMAQISGHSDVVEYLNRNGADISDGRSLALKKEVERRLGGLMEKLQEFRY